MLLKYPSAKDIEKSRFDTFANIIESASNGRLDKLKAKEIRKIPAFRTTHQSGNFTSSKAKMDKRGSRYLRYALFISAQYVSMWCPVFKDYYQKKRSKGKHYFVALSHVAKKLISIIYHLQKTGEFFPNFS